MVSRRISTTGVTVWSEGESWQADDYLSAEEPLEIRLGERPLAVTMRTPRDDFDLTAGFLYTEGIINDPAQILSMQHESGNGHAVANRMVVELSAGVGVDWEQGRRNFNATSSCGICGKATLDAVRTRGVRRLPPGGAVDAQCLYSLVERLRAGQEDFSRTGGLHAAALFDQQGGLLAIREDIGRHNAMDKVIGWALRKGRLPLTETVAVVSGRGGFEVVQKALVAGIPVLASVSAPSDLAVKLAREFGMTLVGFLRGQRFVVYSGAERITGGGAATQGATMEQGAAQHD